MGVLLRGTRENFNPQIHTEANSLTVQMKKHFAVRKKTFDLFSRYTKFQSFMYASGRFNNGAKEGKVKKASADEQIADNAYRIAYEGALILPAVSYGAVQVGSFFDPGNASPDMSAVVGVEYTNGLTSATVVTNTYASISIKHEPENDLYGDKFNPNDSIALDAGLGLLFIITQPPRRAIDHTHYVLDGKFVGPEALFKEEHFDEDNVFTEGGNYFGEGSLRGYQRYKRNKWRINYTSIHRTSLTMTGSAKAQKVNRVLNEETGSWMWEYEAVMQNDQLHRLQDELALRYSRISMDPSDHTWFENFGRNRLTLNGFTVESGLNAPILGDGWIPQTEDNLTVDYDPNVGFEVSLLESLMMVLGQRSPIGSSGNVFVMIGDVIGHMAIDTAYKKVIGRGNPAANAAAGSTTISIENVNTKKETQLGFEITKYYYLGNTVYYIQDDIFNNPGLMPTNGGVTGTGHIFVLNTSMVDGVPNLEMISRIGRDLIRKHENGMVSFDETQNAGSVASSGFDGCSIHNLTENMAVLYDMRSCAILRAIAKYNGGALAGMPAIQNGAAAFIY